MLFRSVSHLKFTCPLMTPLLRILHGFSDPCKEQPMAFKTLNDLVHGYISHITAYFSYPLLTLLQPWWPLSCGARVSGVRTLGVVVPRLQSTSSAIVVPGPSCPAACGIFLDQGSNPCLQHWQADSLPLSHQGSWF